MRKNWQNLNKKYEEFSKQNNRAFYPWRTRISQEEKEKNIERLDTTKKDDIIEEVNNRTELKITGELGENKTITNTFIPGVASKDEEVNQLYEQISYFKDIKVVQSGSRGYVQGNKMVLSNPKNISGRQTNYHEIGHMINAKCVNRNSLSQNDKTLNSSISKEYIKSKNVYEKFEKFGVLETNDKIKNKNLELEKIINDRCREELSLMAKNFKGTKVEWFREQKKLIDKIKKEEIGKVYESIDNLEDQNNCTLYDMIDSMTRGDSFGDRVLMSGHGNRYYSDSSMIPEELFANYLTLKLMNADKQLQAFKEAFPQTYDSLEKLKGEALKVLKEKNG